MEQTQFSPENGILSNAEFLQKISCVRFPEVVDNKKISYYNIPAAFDIEVSSFYQNNEKMASMYVWQFGILNWVTVGRTWDELKAFISVLSTILDLNSEHRLIVYIHNFGYEFQFIRKRFNWDKIFFLDERKPVYAISGGLEFRCSWKLSSKSLEKMGNDLQKYHVKKKVGDLDYQLVRTSATPLTDKELGYCENDIRVILSYIQEKIEQDGDITRIPLTNTGYVRNYCRKSCFRKYKNYHNLMSVLTIDADEYSQLKRTFAGGFTHASAKYSGKILQNVGSFDFTSSYPAVMLLEKFPMSKAKLLDRIESMDDFKYYLRNYCCMMDITLENVEPKVSFDHPISFSKLVDHTNVVQDNGRVVTAESLSISCTEVDFLVYCKFYKFSNITIHKMRVYEKAYLPKPFVMSILKLYKDKTVLKGISGEEVNYMISKNMLNAAYGMAVTDIVRDEILYDDDDYCTRKPDIDSALEKYNNSKKRFLFYPWGVWVTAYARRNLFSGIYNCADDYIYSDTDSIKILNPERHLEYIEEYNRNILRKIQLAAEFHNIDPAEFSPLNQKGSRKTIGVWDFEGVYDEFKTIGAKRYMYREGDKYHLTVAGVNKKRAMEYIQKTYKNPFDGLSDKLLVPAEYSGRLTHTYFDTECHGYVTDYLGNVGEYHELSYIHMEPSDYELTLSENYKAFLYAMFESEEEK